MKFRKSDRQVDSTVASHDHGDAVHQDLVARGTSRIANGARTLARAGLDVSRRSIRGIASRGPGTLRAARTGTIGAVSALQTLPDTTLRSLGATSIGLGFGLSFTRARRLAFLAGVVPALMEATIVARRAERPVPTDIGA